MVWAADMRYVERRLAFDDDPMFRGRLDLSRTVFFGHSLGGASAIQACAAAANCAGAIDLDGLVQGPSVRWNRSKSFRYVSADDDWTGQAAERKRIDEILRSARTSASGFVTIPETGHFNFSDRSILDNAFARMMGVVGPIDGMRAIDVTRTTVATFVQSIAPPGPPFDSHLHRG
jgi:pimeloyl-ACP methyl ester carboxylesterase